MSFWRHIAKLVDNRSRAIDWPQLVHDERESVAPRDVFLEGRRTVPKPESRNEANARFPQRSLDNRVNIFARPGIQRNLSRMRRQTAAIRPEA